MLLRHRKPRPLRRAAPLIALAGTLALAWAVGPALSAQRYIPKPEDFEQRLRGVERVVSAPGPSDRGDHGHADEGPVTHLSPVIEAPGRFDAAGIARELRPVELRARDEGGEWSEWLEIANGDPAWFGGADELQIRTRGWRPQGRIHYVNVSGDATAAEGVLTNIRETVSGAVAGVAGLIGGEEAEAEPPKPGIVSRGAWGGKDGCEPRERPVRGKVRAMVVHHTVSSNEYKRTEARDMVLAICRYHRNALGWNDIGYNALVDRFGRIYAGRAGGLRKAVIGAHAQGVNSLTSGVAVLGTHTDLRPSKAAKRGLTHWMAWKLTQHNKPAEGRAWMVSAGGSSSRYAAGEKFRMQRISGHRRTNWTECPGTGLNRKLKPLRSRVQKRIDRFGGSGKGGVGRR